MPPSIPPSMGCLIRCKSSNVSPFSIRSFTTSSSLFSIGPESPKFIDIPLPPQRFMTRPRDVKGKLPTPREVFHRRGPTKKGQTLRNHLKYAAQPPSKAHLESEPASDRVAWKRRMAESRRQNLREGLFELQHRRNNRQHALAVRSQKNQAERDARLNAPQREDERLTSPTVPRAVREVQAGPVPDPQRDQRVAEKKERVLAQAKEKEEARRDALHTLYMHARSFIVTEEQLDATIEKLFVLDPFGKSPPYPSVWSAYGQPETVESMLREVNHTQKSSLAFNRGKRPAWLTGKRLKRIAEELTGGKMD